MPDRSELTFDWCHSFNKLTKCSSSFFNGKSRFCSQNGQVCDILLRFRERMYWYFLTPEWNQYLNATDLWWFYTDACIILNQCCSIKNWLTLSFSLFSIMTNECEQPRYARIWHQCFIVRTNDKHDWDKKWTYQQLWDHMGKRDGLQEDWICELTATPLMRRKQFDLFILRLCLFWSIFIGSFYECFFR